MEDHGLKERSAHVALLAEGVDRNFGDALVLPENATVALLAEGVDRNTMSPTLYSSAEPSPSSRRAWIEIVATLKQYLDENVALLAEGVDRNL